MTRRRWKGWRLPALAVLLVLVCFGAYGFAETYRVEVKEYTFASPDLPPDFEGTRVVLITDVHRGPFFSQNRVAGLVARVNALQPDVVVLGGDYVYLGTDYAASCFAELAKLQAPLGRFAVLGNHDYDDDHGRDDPETAIAAIEEADITLLLDQGVWVEKGESRIRLGGVSDFQMGQPRLAPVTDGTQPSDFIVLISHHPDFAETLPAGAVDLVLSGHTHGGQVTFFGLWAFHVPSDYGQKYRTGQVTNGATTVIISNGIGTSTIPPVRLFARPQIVVITLERGSPRL
ncbi:MAG: hypothetical protein A2133_09375 [Actinobacteria bacterium RBG_16_64_13]|nr:MAG: hypothetical protein A2133_09375 [Actinobacteria bacterium RBG_16_64_13]